MMKAMGNNLKKTKNSADRTVKTETGKNAGSRTGSLRTESNIGIVEFKSISRGFITTDEMLKASKVVLVLATTLCPGKYLTIIEGNMAAVTRSIETADRIGGRHVFSSFTVGGINSEVIEAIGGKVAAGLKDSIAIIESQHMANLISAADISVDSADVEIAEMRLGRGCGVNSFYVITGSLSAVEEAVKNAAVFLKDAGALIASRIIPNPDRDLLRWLEPAICMC